jgi:hypothetical protein
MQLQKDWLLFGVVKSSLKDLEKHVAEYDKKYARQVTDSLPSGIPSQ